MQEEIKTTKEMLELVGEDESLIEEIITTTKNISEKVEKLNLLIMLSGPYDKNDCILEIHPGAGGTESCDWSSM